MKNGQTVDQRLHFRQSHRMVRCHPIKHSAAIQPVHPQCILNRLAVSSDSKFTLADTDGLNIQVDLRTQSTIEA